MNFYFRRIVPLRKKKRSNDFSRLQRLHKSSTPLPFLSNEMTDNEDKRRIKNIIKDIVSQKKKRQLLLLKEKKKGHFRDLVY